MAGWGTGAQTLARNLSRQKRKGTSSDFRGVTRATFRGKPAWKATAYYQNRQEHLGYFSYTEDGELQAARAFDAKARELWGHRANLNFPEEF